MRAVPIRLLAAFAVFLTATSAESRDKPNIVFMFADDLGHADLGCYGHPYAKTPHLDQLAKEGTRFTQFYVTGVTCNPSRTGLMTGRFPARFPEYAADFGFADRVTITELLKERGYRTGHFGKWHIGPESADGTYGIDQVEVIGKSRDRSAGRDTDLYAAAIDFIEENKDEPFYVNIWGHATHFPVDTPTELITKFNQITVDRSEFSETMQHKFDECLQIGGELDESMRQYLGDVYQIDQNVGRVLQAIEELGLKNNTIVVFSSDHGPAPVILGKQGARKFSNNMLGYAGELRGGKHSQYEGGLRVPFIVRWPGRVQAGRVDTTSVCSFIDWLPTLCNIAGIKELPSGLDGEDCTDIWLGTSRERSEPLFWKASAPGSAPVIRDGQWKLHLNRKRDDVAMELYDISNDVSESRNVIGEHPGIAARLSKALQEWVTELPEDYEKLKGKGDKDE